VIDHVTIRVSDFEASKAFYSCVLAPLGLQPHTDDTFAEWGDFSIAADDKPVAQNVHIAFPAKSREEVDAFHRAAMDAGYRDNGPPAERPVYHEGYYGAFVMLSGSPRRGHPTDMSHSAEKATAALARGAQLD
jgi:catechol 2,3-dioxygenase-like lactoylglutathione lyase family enzyme